MGYSHYHVRLYQYTKVLLQSLILCQLLKVAAPGTGHGNAGSLQNWDYIPRDLPWRSHILRSLHSAFTVAWQNMRSLHSAFAALAMTIND